MMHTFSVYNFSDKEIDQIVDLTKRWANNDHWFPIDGRKYTKQVKEYALHWSLLERKEEDDRLYLTKGYLFNVRGYLPKEALWRLVKPMLREDGSAGYAIVNNKLWRKHLGEDPQDSRSATENDLRIKEAILLELDQHGYIYFQMAGNVWSIRTRERKAA